MAKIEVHLSRDEKPGLQPREIKAIVDDQRKRITISETIFGPGGGKSFHQQITLPLSDWRKLLDSYEACDFSIEEIS